MKRHLTRLAKSVGRLGLRNGGAVYADYLLHRAVPPWKWRPRETRLRGLRQKIWLRPGVSDWIVMERIFLDREYDPLSVQHDAALDRLQTALLASGKKPLIVDCGANIGLSAVWFAHRFPQATIIAVEPEPENFRILSLNARNYPRILPVRAGISDIASRITLSNVTDAPWSWVTQESETGDVSAVTIDSLLGLDPDYALMIVKVDIEGAECRLFRSATDWVNTTPLLVFEMHDWMAPWSGSGHAFMSALAQQRRDYLVRGENIFAYAHAALNAAAP